MENSKHHEAVTLVIQLDARDNVGVLARSVPDGGAVQVGDQVFVLPEALGLGHKLALRPIAAGTKILKYGASIGSATSAIRVGEHVHLHNIQSDYLPTHILTEGQKFEN